MGIAILPASAKRAPLDHADASPIFDDHHQVHSSSGCALHDSRAVVHTAAARRQKE